jgi:hypothetical protein
MIARREFQLPLAFLIAAGLLAAAALSLGAVSGTSRHSTAVTGQGQATSPATDKGSVEPATKSAPARSSGSTDDAHVAGGSADSANGRGQANGAVLPVADAGSGVVAPVQSSMCGPRPCPHP